MSSRAATRRGRAVSRSGPWATTLPSIGSYDVLTHLAALQGVVDPDARVRSGQRTIEAVPACGRKPPYGSSA